MDGNRDILRDIWPDWHIVRRIGSGGYGAVYEAVSSDRVESHAAVKVISIPQSEDEPGMIRAEGLTEDSVRTYYRKMVEDFTDEIRLMETLKGHQHIVGIEDHRVVERTDRFGWDIYIRMELLIPLTAHLRYKKLTEQDVIRLGTELCSALERCARVNVIHRDIKPENIFVNNFGDFKLGDFGIARKLQSATARLSRRGTYLYMAPEVERGESYDASADLYSLGLVMYRLMNRNRLPFMETEQLTDPEAWTAAAVRRLSGERLPRPAVASDGLARAILRACEYDPSARFSSAREMRRALEALLQPGPVLRRETPELSEGKTAPVRNGEKVPASPEPPRKPGTGRLSSRTLTLIAAGLLCVSAALLAMPGKGGRKAVEPTIEPTAAEQTAVSGNGQTDELESGQTAETESGQTAAAEGVPVRSPLPVPTGQPMRPKATATPAPAPAGKPGPKDMAGCNKKIYVPDGTWLPAYQIKYVDGYRNTRIIVKANPYGKAQSNDIGYIEEETEVLLLAKENGYVLVSVDDTCVGWVNPKYLVDVYTNAHT